jgi:predicted O-methyltransferase YrrM
MSNTYQDFIYRFCEDYATLPHEQCKPLRERSEAIRFPLIDDQTGALLQLLCGLHKPKRVLELGSGFGYSALFFAKALAKDAELFLCSYEIDQLQEGEKIIAEINPELKVTLLDGEALEEVEKVEGSFDLIFIDVDKRFYYEIMQKSIKKLNENGLLIFDNAFFRGRIFDKSKDKALSVQNLHKVLEDLKNNADFETFILPVGDGVLVAKKIISL